MPTLTVVAGPNGSGKSTLTRWAQVDTDALVDPDAIARELSPNDPAAAALTAGREALRRIARFLEERKSFIVETTLAGSSPLATIRGAKLAGYYVIVVYIALGDPLLQVDRVQLRVRTGGHGVPEPDVRRRYERSLANAPEALRLADEAVVLDNSGSRQQHMLTLRLGRVVWRADALAPWVEEVVRAVSADQ